MKKQHSTPEFTIIRVNQSNRKFFVASGSPEPPTTEGTTLGSMGFDNEGWGDGDGDGLGM